MARSWIESSGSGISAARGLAQIVRQAAGGRGGNISRHRRRRFALAALGWLHLLDLPAQQDAVDHLQERQRARLDDVSADAAAAEGLAVVLGLDRGLALGVFANRHAAHPVIL